MEVKQTLHDVSLSPAGTIYKNFGGSCPNGILPGAKFTLRPSLVFSHIGSITAQHSSSGLKSAKLCGVVQEKELRNFCSSSFSTEGTTYIPKAAITLGIGPHSSCYCYNYHYHYDHSYYYDHHYGRPM